MHDNNIRRQVRLEANMDLGGLLILRKVIKQRQTSEKRQLRKLKARALKKKRQLRKLKARALKEKKFAEEILAEARRSEVLMAKYNKGELVMYKGWQLTFNELQALYAHLAGICNAKTWQAASIELSCLPEGWKEQFLDD